MPLEASAVVVPVAPAVEKAVRALELSSEENTPVSAARCAAGTWPIGSSVGAVRGEGAG